MRVTLKDIARELGMNESTVSYALTGKGSIKEKTRLKVRETAEKLGYVPNQAARQTSTGRSNSVAIVVPNVLTEYGEFCEHAFRILSGRGYQTQILITEFSVERELEIVRGLIGQNIAGVIMIPAMQPDNHTESASVKQLLANGVATVVRNAETGAPAVSIDFEAIGYGLGERFRCLKRRKICIAVPHSGPFAVNVTGVMRGLEKALEDSASIRIEAEESSNNMQSFPPGVNRHYEYQIRDMLLCGGIDAGRRIFRRLFREPVNRPDAIVCPHEVCALGILLEAEVAGIKIPEVFDLVACQKGIWGNTAPKRIAAGFVSQERLAMSMTACLFKLLNGKKVMENEFLRPEFNDGETLITF